MPSEKQLDQDLDVALRDDARFLAWFVSRLSRGASYPTRHWSRANYAWGKVKVMLPNKTTGALEFMPREGETDVLLVLEGADGRRLGVHIENKLASGSFTPYQPEVCTARAEAWVGNPQYQSYHEWETVLLAPQAFYDRNEQQARKFSTFVSHEEVGKWLPSFLPK